jgi:hypothetical protein
MNRRTGRGAVLIISLISLTSCGSGQQQTTQLLEQRLQVSLAPDVAAGRASVQNLPDGALVTLLEPSSFPNDKRALDDADKPDVRANVIEGLLDPSLIRVALADTSTLPADRRDTRVANVAQYFAVNGLGGVLVPPGASPPAAGPAGLAITIRVQCPRPNGRTGYGDGTSKPVCD